eukprot:symbB.v1.2.013751.t1/scaffold976.1/size149240/4
MANQHDLHTQPSNAKYATRQLTSNWPALLELLSDPQAPELLASPALRAELADAIDRDDCAEAAVLRQRLERLEVDSPIPRLKRPRRFHPLPLGHVKPQGWLKEVIRRSAEGLAGHLFEFYPPVVDSNFLGGQ